VIVQTHSLSLSLSEDVKIKYKTVFNLITKSDGETYLKPVTHDLRMIPKTGNVYAGNLFNGNKLLGETQVLQFSNPAVIFV
jgi:hypothetical protein